MSIWINEHSKVLVQGITGSQGTFHATKMIEYGTDIVGGVTPGKGGQSLDLFGKSVTVYDGMYEAIQATDANASVIYVPPQFAAEAI
ncbi:MAG: succinate--CoA ligase subunit alpha, partial [Euryarchaeota archaeon]|nr:succinate--CoA ligase subunit alpha [Euryarchaeota archaeon]